METVWAQRYLHIQKKLNEINALPYILYRLALGSEGKIHNFTYNQLLRSFIEFKPHSKERLFQDKKKLYKTPNFYRMSLKQQQKTKTRPIVSLNMNTK